LLFFGSYGIVAWYLEEDSNKKAENVTAIIWKTLMIAQKQFRKLRAPGLMSEVADGAIYINGEKIKTFEQKVAA
jgi:hypothetical protein